MKQVSNPLICPTRDKNKILSTSHIEQYHDNVIQERVDKKCKEIQEEARIYVHNKIHKIRQIIALVFCLLCIMYMIYNLTNRRKIHHLKRVPLSDTAIIRKKPVIKQPAITTPADTVPLNLDTLIDRLKRDGWDTSTTYHAPEKYNTI